MKAPLGCTFQICCMYNVDIIYIYILVSFDIRLLNPFQSFVYALCRTSLSVENPFY